MEPEPFPSLVKMPDYPGVALADVKSKTGALLDATNQGRQMFDPSWPLETIKMMTIDEKIAFWRAVMQHARDRGIDVTIFTWNIFVFGTEAAATASPIAPANPTTKDYVRKSVRALFNTYPLLTAIGITSGENMGDARRRGQGTVVVGDLRPRRQGRDRGRQGPRSPFLSRRAARSR